MTLLPEAAPAVGHHQPSSPGTQVTVVLGLMAVPHCLKQPLVVIVMVIFAISDNSLAWAVHCSLRVKHLHKHLALGLLVIAPLPRGAQTPAGSRSLSCGVRPLLCVLFAIPGCAQGSRCTPSILLPSSGSWSCCVEWGRIFCSVFAFMSIEFNSWGARSCSARSPSPLLIPNNVLFPLDDHGAVQPQPQEFHLYGEDL